LLSRWERSGHDENHTMLELAKTAGVNVETIRYYERRGLIRQTTQNPQRDTVQNQTQPWLGFYSSNVPRNWVLRWRRSTTCCHWASQNCSEVQELAEAKLASVREKINDLHRLQQVLEELVEQCRTNPDNAACPIVESLQPAPRQ